MSIVRDVVFAIRQFRRHPWLPLAVVISLGAAMGMSTSMFSLVDAAWFAPWQVPDADAIRIVQPAISGDEWRALANNVRSFSGLAAHRTEIMRAGGETVFVQRVSVNYFDVLRVPMLAGRSFAARDADANANASLAVIGAGMWQHRFGGDPHIIGKTLTLDPLDRLAKSVTLTVVGVASQEFTGTGVGFGPELWVPLSGVFDGNVEAFGRLTPGTRDALARSELDLVSRRFRSDRGLSAAPVALTRTDRYSQVSSLPPQTRFLWEMMLGGVTFITLIACANVANLLLALGQTRAGEIALRLALGASRQRLVRQLLTETLVLSLVAGAVGIAIAAWLPDAILGSFASVFGLGGLPHVGIDHRVMAWAVGISVFSCFVFGLVPAWRNTDGSLNDAVKRGHANSRKALMPALLSYQTIVSVMALAIAGFMLRSGSVVNARSVGASVAGLTAVHLDLSRELDQPARAAIVAAISARLDAQSGRHEVAGIVERLQAGALPVLHVTPNYFQMVRLAFKAGRTFATTDSTERALVVNEAFARRVWPDSAALGRTIGPANAAIAGASLVGREVIGVISDDDLGAPTAFLPAPASDVQTLLLHAPTDLVAREAAAVGASLDPPVPITVESGSAWLAPLIGPSFLVAWIIAGFGVVALLLGTIGYLSVLEYLVGQRTREIGIRRALGAQNANIIRAVTVGAAVPVARGFLVGGVGAGVVGIVLRQASTPAGVHPFDPLTYVAVAAVLLATTACAAFWPTRHALRIEPQEALRAE
jgi:putative ABC transport system permease protein